MDNEHWLRLADETLSAQAMESIPRGIYRPPPVWTEAPASAHTDRERFPGWAEGAYEACIYWKRTYTRDMLNQARSSGEPRIWDIAGTATGWILVSQGDVHILELTLHEQWGANEATYPILDAWESSPK